MILDRVTQDHYDVIIIGSGPAGISTALQLANNNPSVRVAIIESGLLEHDQDILELSRVELVGELPDDYFPMHTQRRFGGSSTIWGGFCAVLEKRAFMDQSWPIPYEELERWYPEAAQVIEVPENIYRRSSTHFAKTSDIVYKPFYLSPPVRFNVKYGPFIAQHPNIHLILGATCTQLDIRDETVDAIRLKQSVAPHRNLPSLTADRFVLACGGIGNPRLMQLSGFKQQLPVGLGLMEHPHLYAVAEMYLDQDRIKPSLEKQAPVVHALQLSDSYCVDHGLLSFSADFNLEQLTSEPLMGRREETILTPVTLRTETPPHPDCYVELGDKMNALDQPWSRVGFRFHCEELAQESWLHFSRALLKSGLGRPSTLKPKFKPAGGGHLMGTTRMGFSEEDSVVDGNCKVHTTDNLYIAGSSIFPAGGASHPTYTIVAMALRLGDYLASLTQPARTAGVGGPGDSRRSPR
ncbi:GMC family oxidoreductase [Marinobacter nanhaiticus D15-8W]|uniref:GMC family oxidoreductase n=1 Tax=Marinobacter nanhaiticus D15-8W TaxID=626887 RepID=N6WP60_9GAMM|nr:GMC oxidoreductase [Marinobacter nanhaiticus]ENO12832.1 GMC family oxidoreductase [Marinobacter nanhaiticus D15-8W]BES70181.1 GMC family oxidoreductase [Marinobacter nanhaiticus D15-8W]